MFSVISEALHKLEMKSKNIIDDFFMLFKIHELIANVAITGERSRASVSPANEMSEVDRVVRIANINKVNFLIFHV